MWKGERKERCAKEAKTVSAWCARKKREKVKNPKREEEERKKEEGSSACVSKACMKVCSLLRQNHEGY